MSIHLDALLYPMADALQTQLHINMVGKSPLIYGESSRKVSLGPWAMPLTIKVQSCVVTDNLVTAQVHIKHNLWMYVLCDSSGQRLRAVLFDAAQVSKLKSKSANLGSKAEEVAAILKPVIRVYLQYVASTEQWSEVDAFNLV